jgi:hypothetical protein
MTVVAIVGLILGFAVWSRRLKERRDYCLQQASNEARREKFFRSMESRDVSRSPQHRLSIIVDGLPYQAATLAAYYAERKEKYLRAASVLLLSVPPALQPGEFYIFDPLQRVFYEKAQRFPQKPDDSPRF